jgi:hypothetical protein
MQRFRNAGAAWSSELGFLELHFFCPQGNFKPTPIINYIRTRLQTPWPGRKD